MQIVNRARTFMIIPFNNTVDPVYDFERFVYLAELERVHNTIMRKISKRLTT